MYTWRKMSDVEREAALEYRRIPRYPKHSPPHFDSEMECQYLFSSSCYEHADIIGGSPERMSECERDLLKLFQEYCVAINAWCILPNHYHALIKTARMKDLRKAIGLYHGRSSHIWNGEDNTRGRQVWHNCFERKMRSERHFFATLNYVLHNPVHHGYVKQWEDWPWSNATEYLNQTGRETALTIWKEYPILDYGRGWDD